MKKTIAILLVAVLAVSSVFAGFTLSGEANVSLKGSFDDKTLGFTNGDNKVKVAIEGATAEKVNEGDIYAGVKAVLELDLGTSTNVAIDEKYLAGITNPDDIDVKKLLKIEAANFIKVKTLEVKEAYITDGNWKLSILSAATTPTFAKGWEVVKDGNDDKAPVLGSSVASKYTKDGKEVSIPGVTLEVAGWKAGVGLDANFNEGKGKNVLATVATPSFSFDAVSVKAGAGFANADGKFSVGGGAEAKYATDAVSATVAADAVYTAKDEKFNAAVRANVAVAPVTVDAFFATKTNLKNKVTTYVDRAYAGKGDKAKYLSAKVVGDLNSFDVPVTITAAGLDLINDQYFDVEAKATVSGVNGKVYGGYQISNKTYHVGVAADYTLETVGKIYGQFTLAGAEKLSSAAVKVGVENTTLVSGATLKLEYAGADFVAKKAGAVTASAQIKF